MDRYRRDGLVVLRDAVPTELVAAVAAATGRRVKSGTRVQDLWRREGSVRRLAAEQTVVDAIEAFTGTRPIPFQTLNFSVGTEQPLHADLAHFAPEGRGRITAAWVALEEVASDQGPLTWVPGSHLASSVDPSRCFVDDHFDDATYTRLVEDSIERRDVRTVDDLSPGDVVVWDGALLHGGAPIRSRTSSRRSQVTHYVSGAGALVNPRAPLSRPDRRRRGQVDIALLRPLSGSHPGSLDAVRTIRRCVAGRMAEGRDRWIGRSDADV